MRDMQPAPSGEQALPASRYASLRAGHRLVDGMAVRRRQFGAAEHRFRDEVVEPVLTRLEALDHGMSGLVGMLAGVLVQRVVAAADVAALRAAAQVEPPAAGRLAFDAAGSTRRHAGVDALALGHEDAPGICLDANPGVCGLAL